MSLKLGAQMRNKLGTWIHHVGNRNGIPHKLRQLFHRIETDYGIRTVLDVGGNVGEFSDWCASCFPQAAIHVFEPLPVCQPSLSQLTARHANVRVHPVAVGNDQGRVTMYQNDYAPSSSFLPMLDRHRELWPKTEGAQEISVEITTIDRLNSELDFESPIFLKADVQGYEIHVLEGAEETLAKTVVIMLEVLFEPLYDGQSDLQEFLNHLSARGSALWNLPTNEGRHQQGSSFMLTLFSPKIRHAFPTELPSNIGRSP